MRQVGVAGGTAQRVFREARVPRTPHAANEVSCTGGEGCAKRETRVAGTGPATLKATCA
jgi:hypothetical protein